MKSVTRIAFPLIALASAVFTSCGGGGGGEENDYYVSVKQFASGRGFEFGDQNYTILVTPSSNGGNFSPAKSLSTIRDNETGGRLPNYGEPDESVHVGTGTLKIPTIEDPIVGGMDYYVCGGPTGHGILFIEKFECTGEDSNKLKSVFHLVNNPLWPDATITHMSITVDFNFSNHTAQLYFNCEVGFKAYHPQIDPNSYDFKPR